MKDPDWRRREQAVEDFLQIREEDRIIPLAALVETEPFIIRGYFCRLLGKLGRESGLPYLISFLDDENEMVREEAAAALDRIESDKKYDLLLETLEKGEVFSKCYAAETLGSRGQVYAVLSLIRTLSDPEVEVRLKVIEALRLLRDVKAIKPIKELLEDPEPEVRYAAIFTLGDMEGREAAGEISALLEDSHPQVRRLAAWALGQFQLKRTGKRLVDRWAREEEPEVRCQIIRSLTSSGDKKLAKKSLNSWVKDENRNIRSLADYSLRRLGEQRNGDEVADVCLILEGTYPYFPGGVSSWVRNLIKGLPHIRFSLLHLAPFENALREFEFSLPDNVVNLSEVYLQERKVETRSGRGLDEKVQEELKEFLHAPEENRWDKFDKLIDCLHGDKYRKLLDQAFLFSPQAWDFLVDIYKEKMPGETSFVDFFWTYRSIVLPLLQLFKADIPPAGVYHTISTGYAGFLGVLAHKRTGKPLLLTEHGIYHEERRIEIASADWVYTRETDSLWAEPLGISLKDIWIGFFNTLSKLTYEYSERVVTLYEDNRRLQLEMGAKSDKTMIIPNGIQVELFSSLKREKEKEDIFRVGLVGRIVPIKDIKTFIRTCRIITEKIPRVEFLIMGPLDEDPGYAEECRMLSQVLGLEEKIRFTGNIDVRLYYPKLDVLVLTSISEAQPLVVIEAMGVGIPVVATHVGSCAELLLGREEADRELGAAGLIVSIGNPQEAAGAVLKIFADDNLRQKMKESGRRRIERYYRQEKVVQSYDKLYRELMQ